MSEPSAAAVRATVERGDPHAIWTKKAAAAQREWAERYAAGTAFRKAAQEREAAKAARERSA